MEVCCETVVACVEPEIIKAVLGCQKIDGINPRCHQTMTTTTTTKTTILLRLKKLLKMDEGN
jgi:hypothetical protein